MDHPPYSPNLTHSDFHVFGLLTKQMPGKQFATDAKMKQAVTSWLQMHDTYFFCAEIQASVARWDKCLNVNSNSV
jgi:hypothetical protein